MTGGFSRSFLAGLTVFLFLASGCVAFPAARPLAESRQVQAAFMFREAMARQQQDCPNCLDAQARVSLKSVVQHGTVSGFVQAMAPSFLKFTALNPLGQPLLFLATDGGYFRYLSVLEGRAYEGPVSAEAFNKYAPQGFDPSQGFYWLTGRLAPEEMRIFSVAEDRDGLGLWLELAYEADLLQARPLRRHVLFDPARQVIRRHQVADASGRTLLDVWYDDHVRINRDGNAVCRLPGLVRVHAGDNGAFMEFAFEDWLLDASFTPDDFHLALPSGFILTPVK